MCEATGRTPPELVTPPAPAGAAHLLAWFADLAAGRGVGYMAPLPLSYSEMEAWARLTGRTLTPWEVLVLRRLDNAYLATWNEAQATKGP